MPLVSRTFDQLIDFTRTSAATYVDASGRIVPTAASRNLLTFTQEFDNAGWGKTGATVTANAATAPDGTLTADTLVESAAAGVHYVSETVTGTAVGTTYTASVYAKPNGRNWIILEMSGATIYASFNVATGAVGTTSGSPTTTITPVGNGWYRCSMTKAIGAGISAIRVYTASADNTTSYTGDGTSGIYLWGAQLEAVPDANLVLGSELVTNGDFSGGTTTGWTAAGSATLSVSSGAMVVTNGATAFGYAYQGFTTVIGKTYRVSFAVTGGSVSGSLYIGTTIGGAENYSSPNRSAGTYTVDFTATATTTYLRVGTTANTSGATASFDNISVKEITAITGMPTDYTRNNGGVFPPRFDYDPVTLEPKGLLVEEQRTNLALYSNDLTNAAWVKTNCTTALTATGPDGVANSATTLTASAANATVLQTITSASAARATTCYIRRRTGTGVIDMTQDNGVTWASVTVTSSWTRVSIASATVANPVVGLRIVTSGDAIDVALFQCESGAFATSAIPTAASQVTRTADVATITGANFSQWYNQSEGTFVVEYSRYQNAQFGVAIEVKEAASGSTANRLLVSPTASADPRFQNVMGGTSVQDTASTFGVLAANTVVKAAVAYKSGDNAATRNGASPATSSTTFATQAYTNLQIGQTNNAVYGGTAPFSINGHIRSIRYYPTRLSNAQLQALTA